MGTFKNLNTIISIIRDNAIIVGATVAGLMIAVYAIMIMLDNDTSPAARAQRWERLKRVVICAIIIAGAGAFVTLATSLGKML